MKKVKKQIQSENYQKYPKITPCICGNCGRKDLLINFTGSGGYFNTNTLIHCPDCKSGLIYFDNPQQSP